MPKPITAVEPKVMPDPKLKKRTRRIFTVEYKLSILQQADACKHGELGALLRCEKLCSNQLAQWRHELAEQGVAGLKSLSQVPHQRKRLNKSALSSLKKKTSAFLVKLK